MAKGSTEPGGANDGNATGKAAPPKGAKLPKIIEDPEAQKEGQKAEPDLNQLDKAQLVPMVQDLQAKLLKQQEKTDSAEQDKREKEAKVRELEQANKIRDDLKDVIVESFGKWFWFLAVALVFAFVDITEGGNRFHLPEAVAMVVFGSTTVTIIGLFWIMASHFFYRGSYNPKKVGQGQTDKPKALGKRSKANQDDQDDP